MRLFARFMAIAIVLAASTVTRADSILVGTDLTTSSGGSGLCPDSSDCEEVAQQFTFLSPVVIDQIKVAIGGPNRTFGPPGSGGFGSGTFDVALGSQLGTGIGIGTSTLTYPVNGPAVTQIFDFTGLKIALAPGTYYLEVSGDNLQWTFAEPLTTSTGTIGSIFSCDPTVPPFGCSSSSSWQSPSTPGNPYAFEIDGTTTPVPEPSSWLLLGAGALGLFCVNRAKRDGLSSKVM